MRDMVARKTFSKLRCAIAGVYAYRRMFAEAEHAFQQAVDLYPLSPEANFRLAELYMQSGQFESALNLLVKFRDGDPLNDKIQPLINNVGTLLQMNSRMLELQNALKSNRATPEMAIELAGIYLRAGHEQYFRELCKAILSNTDLPPKYFLEVARLYSMLQPPAVQETIHAVKLYTERQPGDPHAWLTLATLYAQVNDLTQAMNALRQAIGIGGHPLRDAARSDPRLNPLRNLREFQQLVAPQTHNMLPF